VVDRPTTVAQDTAGRVFRPQFSTPLPPKIGGFFVPARQSAMTILAHPREITDARCFAARTRFVSCPFADRGVRLASYAAGIRYQGRDDVMVRRADAGQHGRRRLHPIDDAGSAGHLVPRMPAARHGAGDRRQLRQRQRIHRARRLAGSREHRRHRGKAVLVRSEGYHLSSTGVIGEPPPADRISAALPHIVELLDAGAWEKAGARS